MPARSRLSPEVREQIGRVLASGCSLEVAAVSVGVSRRTVQSWLATGREAEELQRSGVRLSRRQRQCLELLEVERRARADLRVRALTSIQRSALNDNWQAAAWLLERLFPDEYGKQKAGPHPGGRPVGSVSAPDRRERLRLVGE
jgi:hypothetical protein